MATTRDRYILDVETRGAAQSVSRFGGSVSALGASLKGLGLAAVGAAIVDVGRRSLNAASEFQNFRNQLNLITGSGEETEQMLTRLNSLAVDNRAAFADTVGLYTRLSLATENLNVSQSDLIDVTSKFQQALAISGADAGTAAGAIRQFGQAMASGTVRGDEFVSIVEALGPALNIMARESGVTVGELRELSQSGQLTAEVFFDMIQQSTALGEVFNQTNKTINQQEQEFGDALRAASAYFAENIGLADAYSNSLDNVSRFLREVSDNQTNLEAASLEDLVNDEALGSASRRLQELEARYRNFFEVVDDIGAEGLENVPRFRGEVAQGLSDAELALIDYRNALQEAIEEQQAQQDALNESTEAARQFRAEFGDLIANTDRYARANENNNSELTKAREGYIQTAADLETLNSLLGTNAEEHIDVAALIQETAERHEYWAQQLSEVANGVDNLSDFERFYRSILETSRETVGESDLARRALSRLQEQFDSGAISAEVYANAFQRLNTQLLDSRGIARVTTDTISSLADGTDDLRTELSQIGMTDLERDIDNIERRVNGTLSRAFQKLQQQVSRGFITQEEANAAFEGLQENARETESLQIELRRDIERTQRSFSTGWERAFNDYADEATNAARQAERIFETTTQGIEDAIVNFARTGKFEFRDLVNVILEELLRLQVQQTVAQIFNPNAFGGGSSGGGGSSFLPGGPSLGLGDLIGSIGSGIGSAVSGIGDFFGGFFATGGMIPPNRFGVVGENGPELVSGPANVTPMGNTQVTYNINAVDARSFRELVATDPQFIYAVTEQGRKSVPGRR